MLELHENGMNEPLSKVETTYVYLGQSLWKVLMLAQQVFIIVADIVSPEAEGVHWRTN